MFLNIFINREDLKIKFATKFPDVSFTIIETDNIWQLERIIADDRGHGRGTAFMNELCSVADANQKIIVLTPDLSFGASSIKRLKSFYKRFGFELNKGRKRDFSLNYLMIRQPKNI